MLLKQLKIILLDVHNFLSIPYQFINKTVECIIPIFLLLISKYWSKLKGEQIIIIAIFKSTAGNNIKVSPDMPIR